MFVGVNICLTEAFRKSLHMNDDDDDDDNDDDDDVVKLLVVRFMLLLPRSCYFFRYLVLQTISVYIDSHCLCSRSLKSSGQKKLWVTVVIR